MKYACNQCDYQTGYRHIFTKHIQTIHDEDIKYDESAPQNIKLSNLVNTNENYECEQCHQIFSGRSPLWRHKKVVHEGEKYACNQCDYQTGYPHALTRHISRQHRLISNIQKIH